MAESSAEKFRGVLCCSLDKERNVHDTVMKLLDLTKSSVHLDVNCFDLELKNKYYQTTVHLFDQNSLGGDIQTINKLHEVCHAIILYANGQTVTLDQLNQEVEKLTKVGGEPRILLCDGIDEDCPSYSTLREWSLKSGYDLLLTDEEDVNQQLIDSLSAYRWPTETKPNKKPSTSTDERQLDSELMKKLMDFDSLLGKMRAFKDKPELRGDVNDKNIEEIAEILTGLLGDEVDNFLDCESDTLPANNHD